MVVMAISDVLTLNFFWMVRDEGSWLDIGTSISHFCISSLLGVFVAGLEFLSEVFVSGVDVGEGVGKGVVAGKRKEVRAEGKGEAKERSSEGNGVLRGSEGSQDAGAKRGLETEKP